MTSNSLQQLIVPL